MGVKLGETFFVVGFLLALVVGLLQGSLDIVKQNAAGIYTVLALFGLLVGCLNISTSEAQGFLIACIALIVLNALTPTLAPLYNGPLAAAKPYVDGFLGAIGVFVAPAALVVSLVSVYTMASREEEGMLGTGLVREIEKDLDQDFGGKPVAPPTMKGGRKK